MHEYNNYIYLLNILRVLIKELKADIYFFIHKKGTCINKVVPYIFKLKNRLFFSLECFTEKRFNKSE